MRWPRDLPLPGPTEPLLCTDVKQAENKYGGDGPECVGDCGGPECLSEYCGNGSPPAPGPTWCSPSMEFWAATSFQNCQQVCGNDGPPTASDQFNFCLGAWTSDLCFYAYGGFFCGDGNLAATYGSAAGGGPAPTIGPMVSHSAIRECAGWNWLSPVPVYRLLAGSN